MSVIIFAVDYSESFRRGVNCPLPPRVELEVDVASLPVEDRELLAGRLNAAGVVRSRSTTYSHGSIGGLSDQPITAPSADLAGVLAAVRGQDAAIEAEVGQIAARREAEIVAYAAASLEDLVSADWSHYGRMIGGARSWTAKEYVGAYTQSSHEDPRAKARYEEARADADRRNSDLKAAEDQRREAAQQERVTWIAAHGSLRLQRLLAEGIGHDATYRQERDKHEAGEFAAQLAAHRPGWYLIDASDLETDVSDLSLRSLALLDQARGGALVDPSAVKLGRQKSTKKIVAYETFLGRLIAWPKD